MTSQRWRNKADRAFRYKPSVSWTSVIWHHTKGRTWIRLSGTGTVRGPARRPHYSMAIISLTVQLWSEVFWVISVYFNIRNTLPKSGTFLLGHPVYMCVYVCVCIYIYIYIYSLFVYGCGNLFRIFKKITVWEVSRTGLDENTYTWVTDKSRKLGGAFHTKWGNIILLLFKYC